MLNETGLPGDLHESVVELVSDTCKVIRREYNGRRYIIFKCKQYARDFDTDAPIKYVDHDGLLDAQLATKIKHLEEWTRAHFMVIYTPETDTVWLMRHDDGYMREIQQRTDRGVPMSLWMQYTMLIALDLCCLVCRVCNIEETFVVVPYMRQDAIRRHDAVYVRVMHMQTDPALPGLVYLTLLMLILEHVPALHVDLPWNVLGDTVIEQATLFKTNAGMRYAFIMCFLTDTWTRIPTEHDRKIASVYTNAFEHLLNTPRVANGSMHDFVMLVGMILFPSDTAAYTVQLSSNEDGAASRLG